MIHVLISYYIPSYIVSAYDLEISVVCVTNYEESEKKETCKLSGYFLVPFSVILTK